MKKEQHFTTWFLPFSSKSVLWNWKNSNQFIVSSYGEKNHFLNTYEIQDEISLVNSIKLSDDAVELTSFGEYILAAQRNGHVSMISSKKSLEFKCADHHLTSCVLMDQTLATAGESGQVTLVSLHDQQIRDKFQLDYYPITQVSTDPYRKTLAVSGSCTKLFDIHQHKIVSTLNWKDQPVSCSAFLDQRTWASFFHDGTVAIWDLANTKEPTALQRIGSIVWKYDHEYICTEDGRLLKWTPLQTIKLVQVDSNIHSFDFSRDQIVMCGDTCVYTN